MFSLPAVKEVDLKGDYIIKESTLPRCYYTKICGASNVVNTSKDIKTYKLCTYNENCIIVHVTQEITIFTVIKDKIAFYTKLDLPIKTKDLVQNIYKIRKYVLDNYSVNIDVCCTTSLHFTNKIHTFLDRINKRELKPDNDFTGNLSKMKVMFVRYNFNTIVGNWTGNRMMPLTSMHTKLKLTELNKYNFINSFDYLEDKKTVSILVLKNDILYVSARVYKNKANYKLTILVNGEEFKTKSFKGKLSVVNSEIFDYINDLVTTDLIVRVNPITQKSIQIAFDKYKDADPNDYIIRNKPLNRLTSLKELSENSRNITGKLFYTEMKFLPLEQTYC